MNVINLYVKKKVNKWKKYYNKSLCLFEVLHQCVTKRRYYLKKMIYTCRLYDLKETKTSLSLCINLSRCNLVQCSSVHSNKKLPRIPSSMLSNLCRFWTIADKYFQTILRMKEEVCGDTRTRTRGVEMTASKWWMHLSRGRRRAALR